MSLCTQELRQEDCEFKVSQDYTVKVKTCLNDRQTNGVGKRKTIVESYIAMYF